MTTDEALAIADQPGLVSTIRSFRYLPTELADALGVLAGRVRELEAQSAAAKAYAAEQDIRLAGVEAERDYSRMALASDEYLVASLKGDVACETQRADLLVARLEAIAAEAYAKPLTIVAHTDIHALATKEGT